MRVVVLASEEPLYAPRFHGRLLDRFPDWTVGAILVGPRRDLRTGILRLAGLGGVARLATRVILAQTRARLGGTEVSLMRLFRRAGVPVLAAPTPDHPEVLARLRDWSPDLVLNTQSHILPRSVLEIPRIGCVNRHASLLPRYRGIEPVFWALLEGEGEVGVTLHLMEERIDAGRILARKSLAVPAGASVCDIYELLAPAAANLLEEVLPRVADGYRGTLAEPTAGSYRGAPGPEDVRRFRRAGLRYV